MATYGYTFQSGDGVTPTRLNDARTISNIVDADISASAAIAGSKLADDTITNAKIKSDAAIALSKLATGALPTAITTTTANIVDASVTPAKLSQPLTFATSQASTSGTSITFTGIPSWARRITVMLSGVSTNGASLPIVQLGNAGGIETTGYSGAASIIGGSVLSSSLSTGFVVYDNAGAATNTLSGAVSISNLSGNVWVCSGVIGDSAQATVSIVGGVKTLSDALTQVRVTTAGGTDAFDAGSINISYE